MKVLFVSDLHFSHRALDQNRWDLFRQIRALIAAHSIALVVINGDISEFKSGHNADFVNKVVGHIVGISDGTKVIIVNGNHDGIGAATPFFKFLDSFENITYINEVTEMSLGGHQWLFLPHTRTPLDDWKDVDVSDKFVCAHISVDGVMSESGVRLSEEVKAEFFDSAKLAISGDIHNACEIGSLIYIGSPYMTRFGKPHPTGGVILDTGEFGTTKKPTWRRINFDFPQRLTFDVSSLQELRLELGNCPMNFHLVKIRLHLKTDNMSEWRAIKDECIKMVTTAGHTVAHFEMINEYKKNLSTTQGTRKHFTDFGSFCNAHAVPDDLKTFGLEALAAV